MTGAMRNIWSSRGVPLAMLATLAAGAATPASAQYIGGNAPPPPSAPVGAESAAAALARNVRILAAEPRNFAALMGAGRAALALDDLSAAAGFFGRADELRPNDPAPKIGMGAALVSTGDARGALAWFGRAQALGASPAMIGADRGLAHDLLGELAAAQADYRAALPGTDGDEARRRLALSLAIAGNQSEAIAVLQPLLNRRDPAAQRARAFILALGGQTGAAAQAIEVAMPGASARIQPFFTTLPRLTTVQKAAAVHLGVFPRPDEIRLAAATPAVAATPRPVARASVTPPPAPKPKREKRRATPEDDVEPAVVRGRYFATPAPAQAVPAPARPVTPAPQSSPAVSIVLPSQRLVATPAPTGAAPALTTPLAAAAEPGASSPAPVETVDIPPSPKPVYESPADPAPTLARAEPSPAVVPGDRLSGIDKLLAQTADPKPATPRPAKVAAAAAKPDAKAASAKAASAKKAADAKKADEAKKDLARKKEEAAKLGVEGTYWVQLAGGRNEGNLGREFGRIKAKKGALFAGRSGYVSQGKDYFRLLTGPFDSADDARAFAAKLAKAGIDGFSWTRSPATLKIEKISPK